MSSTRRADAITTQASAPSPASSSGSSTTSSEDGKTILYTQSPADCVSAGGGMMVPAGRTVQLSPRQPGRHPRLLRPAVPVQARRRAGPDEHRSSSRSTTADAGQTFRGQCAELCGTGHSIMLFEVKALSPDPSSTPGWPAEIAAAQRDAATGPERPGERRSERQRTGTERWRGAARQGPTVAVDRQERRVRTDDAHRPGRTRRSRSTSTTRTRARRTTSRSTRVRRAGRSSSRARSSPASPRRPTTSRRWPPAATHSCAPSIRHMTGTLTVQ